ncbi:hypothetical protein BD309DRAFT_1017743 [Dichomitus squalens]|uniref:Uncharacterized protein n=1 Tax=Dichomitus squalens TaxID=114155 RepID=A0A4Q9PWJ6_9APHY|nr:hypothetical protein BD309DRAFT_1017743 [Dichomitus squalens]TBU59062.1 hypothetical protein BD310DRAFT_976954 [Dichomitus squalens]
MASSGIPTAQVSPTPSSVTQHSGTRYVHRGPAPLADSMSEAAVDLGLFFGDASLALEMLNDPSIRDRIPEFTAEILPALCSVGQGFHPFGTAYAVSFGQHPDDSTQAAAVPAHFPSVSAPSPFSPSPTPLRASSASSCSLTTTAFPSPSSSPDPLAHELANHGGYPSRREAAPRLKQIFRQWPYPVYGRNHAKPGKKRCRFCKRTTSRIQELKRHEIGHFTVYLKRKYGDALWACVGVPADSPDAHTVPGGAREFSYRGWVMRGGCGKQFSRKDTFLSHLKKCNRAVGDANAPIFLGNCIPEMRSVH